MAQTAIPENERLRSPNAVAAKNSNCFENVTTHAYWNWQLIVAVAVAVVVVDTVALITPAKFVPHP
jgi:hypothetical protein